MNDQSTSQNFDNRLKKLERQNRLMKYSLLILVSIAAITALTGTNPIKKKSIIEAQGFILRDSLGNKLAEIGYDNPIQDVYRTYFDIFMEDGTPGISIEAAKNKGKRVNQIGVNDPLNNSGIRLMTASYTPPSLMLVHSGSDFFRVSATDTLGAYLLMRQLLKTDISNLSASEKKSVSFQLSKYLLKITSDGSTSMSMFDRDNELKLVLNTEPNISLFTEAKSGMQLTASEITLVNSENMSSVTPTGFKLIDSNGNRAVLGQVDLVTTSTGGTSTTPLSALTLFDKEGKVIWNAP